MMSRHLGPSLVILLLLFLLCVVIVSVDAGADYYKILDLDRGASEDDIKKAYRFFSCMYMYVCKQER